LWELSSIPLIFFTQIVKLPLPFLFLPSLFFRPLALHFSPPFLQTNSMANTLRTGLTAVAVLTVLAMGTSSSSAALIPEANTLANSARGAATRRMKDHNNVMRLTSSDAAALAAAAAADGGAEGGVVQAFSPYVAADGGYDDRLIAALTAAPAQVLRRFLADRGATCAGCFDREALVDAALRVRRAPTADDATAAALTLGEDWAASRLALRAREADGVTSTDSLFEAEVAGAFFDGEMHHRGNYGLTGMPVGAVAGGGHGVNGGGNSVFGALASLFGGRTGTTTADVDPDVAAGVNAYANENRNADPRSRESVLRSLSDEEVASLVQIMDLHNQVDLGRVRCTASSTNSTQFCVPVGATVTRMVTPFADM
jgi:hypothetical protein